MPSLKLIGSLLLTACVSVTTASIQKTDSPPEGYSKGYATQDFEPVGQKSICHTNCGLPGDNAGIPGMKEGVYAAAVGPTLGGNSDNCGPCGGCYSVINSGNPYCKWDDPSCAVSTGPNDQEGPQEIKIMIVNHCMDCNKVSPLPISPRPLPPLPILSQYPHHTISYRSLMDLETYR
ncbi:MAG: hypothetical protein Q9169_006123 [Polycauliona sp. 2 TL-2023]